MGLGHYYKYQKADKGRVGNGAAFLDGTSIIKSFRFFS